VIVLCANRTSWDTAQDCLVPGGQGDRYLSPIMQHLPPEHAVVSRQPRPGSAHVNVYMNHRGIYRRDLYRGERWSVQISHGIASKGYRNGVKVKDFRTIVVPGPAHYREVVGSGVMARRVKQLGYPKLDPVHRGEVASPWPARDGRVRVLWAPTHGGGSERYPDGNTLAPSARATTWWARDELLGLLDPDRHLVMEAPHPRHSPGRRATLEQYVGADVVLADGGSTMYEAWASSLPVVFADWITAERNLTRGRGMLLEHRVYADPIGWHVAEPAQFAATVDAAAAAGISPREVRFAQRVLPLEFRGVGGKLHAEFLMSLEG
jgi:hypothetical protein